MERVPADTGAAAHEVWLEVLRGLSSQQRFENLVALFDQDRELGRHRLARLHPEAGPEQVERMLRRERWGEELYRQVYPDD